MRRSRLRRGDGNDVGAKGTGNCEGEFCFLVWRN